MQYQAGVDRPDFLRMIADSRKREFDYVIVWKLDRFARNRYDSANYKYKLKQNNVRVLSAMENIGESDESIILEAVLEASAEYYSRDLSKKVTRGMRETAMKGGFLGGVPPLGYKVVDKEIIFDEPKATYVKYAFEQYAQGVSKKEILQVLTNKGIKNARGKPLTPSSLQGTFKNRKYTGEYETNGIVMHNYPKLIDNKLFNKVQDRLKEKTHAPAASKAKVDYLLQGKAFCGHCGIRMIGESGRGKGGNVYHYYACSTKKKQHTCDKINERKEAVEIYVVEQTLEYVLAPERIEVIAQAVIDEYEKEFNGTQIKELERRIAKIDRELDKYADTILETENAALKRRMLQKADELSAQRDDLEIDLSKLKIANEFHWTKKDIVLWFKQFCKGDALDEGFRRSIIDVFVNSVYLYNDKIVVFYNIRNGKRVTYNNIKNALDELANGDREGVRISNATPHQTYSKANSRNYYCFGSFPFVQAFLLFHQMSWLCHYPCNYCLKQGVQFFLLLQAILSSSKVITPHSM